MGQSHRSGGSLPRPRGTVTRLPHPMSGARPGDGPGSVPPSGVDTREHQDRLTARTRPSVRIRQHALLTIRITEDRNSLVMRAAGELDLSRAPVPETSV